MQLLPAPIPPTLHLESFKHATVGAGIVSHSRYPYNQNSMTYLDNLQKHDLDIIVNHKQAHIICVETPYMLYLQ